MLVYAVLLLLPSLALAIKCEDVLGNALFQLINKDGKVISLQEFEAFIRKFDTNKDGNLYYKEFFDAVPMLAPIFKGNERLLYYVLTHDEDGRISLFIKDVFDYIDTNNDDVINPEEMRRAFNDKHLLTLTLLGTNIIDIGK